MFRPAEWEPPQAFVPVRVRPKEWEPQDIEQRWFSGVHSDIGGGYPEKESGLSKIPLIWMIDEAEKAGLRVTASNLAKFAHGAPPEKNEQQGSVAKTGHGRAASSSWRTRPNWTKIL